MNIEIDQNATSVRIKIMVDTDDWQTEVAFVYKRWEWEKKTVIGSMFDEEVVKPAMARTFSGSQDGRNPVSTLLRLNIYNAVAAHLAYQLDELFKTREDFKRPIKVVERGPVFFVEWAEETNDAKA